MLGADAIDERIALDHARKKCLPAILSSAS
jgi:hypothetical protein